AAESRDDVLLYRVAVVGQRGGGQVEFAFSEPLSQLGGDRAVGGQIRAAELLLSGVLGALRKFVGLEATPAHLAAPPVWSGWKIDDEHPRPPSGVERDGHEG